MFGLCSECGEQIQYCSCEEKDQVEKDVMQQIVKENDFLRQENQKLKRLIEALERRAFN